MKNKENFATKTYNNMGEKDKTIFCKLETSSSQQSFIFDKQGGGQVKKITTFPVP